MPKARRKVHYKISNLLFSISLIINGKHMTAGRQKDAYTSGLAVTDVAQRLRTVLICSGGVCKWSHLHFLVEMWQVKKKGVICHQEGENEQRGRKKKHTIKQWLLFVFKSISPEETNLANRGRVLFERHYSLFTALAQSHYR